MTPLNPLQEKNIHIGFMAIGLLLVLKGLMPWCILKHRSVRIMQATLGLLLIVIGGPIMDPIITKIPPPPKKPDAWDSNACILVVLDA